MIEFLNALPGAAAQGIIWGIMAIGVYITYKILDIADLTVDGSFGTGGATLVLCMTSGMGLPLSLLIAFLAGCLTGFATGVFHTKFGIPAILAGILTQLGLYSVNLRILGGANLTLSDRKYKLLVNLKNTYPSLLICTIFAVVIIAVLYWFFGTEMGRGFRATGNNEKMARAQGINTNNMKIIGLMLSNGLVGLAGGLYAQYQGNADVNMGRGAIVIGLAAVIIGGVVFDKVFHNFALRLVGVVGGAILYFVVIAVVLWLGLETTDMKLISSLIVALFLAVPHLKGKYAASHVKRGGGKNA